MTRRSEICAFVYDRVLLSRGDIKTNELASWSLCPDCQPSKDWNPTSTLFWFHRSCIYGHLSLGNIAEDSGCLHVPLECPSSDIAPSTGKSKPEAAKPLCSFVEPTQHPENRKKKNNEQNTTTTTTTNNNNSNKNEQKYTH